jgi:hypothetical protein
VFIAKYDRGGVLKWVQQLGTPFNEFLTGITVDRQDNVVVVGYTFGNLFGANKNANNTTSDFFICKFDPAGTQILGIQEGTADIDEAWGVATDGDSNIYIAGGSRGDLLGTVNTGDFDAFVASYTASGSLRWGGAKKVGTPPPTSLLLFDNRDFARSFTTMFGTSSMSRVTSGRRVHGVSGFSWKNLIRRPVIGSHGIL